MTVLTDGEIYHSIMKQEIIIHPILDLNQIQGAKIDLRLANRVYLIKHSQQPYYDPMHGEQPDYGDEKFIGFNEKGFILQPGDFAIAPLFERIMLPAHILGRLDGRSSLGRLGLIVHATAGGIDPGYTGQITCELTNLGKMPVALHPLQRIAALTLETLDDNVVVPYQAKKNKKYSKTLNTMLRSDKEFTTGILKIVNKKL